MVLADDTKLRRRARLPAAAMLAVAPLMALVGGVLAASSSPGSQPPCAQANCVFVLDEGWLRTIGFPFPADPEDSLVGSNDRDLIVGGYIDTEGSHSYFRDRRGRFTTIDVSGAAGTLPHELNDRGQITGTYENPAAAPDHQRSPMRVPGMMSGL
jgi:hypothetical protein